MDIAELLYRVNKHILMLSSHSKLTGDIIKKNMRMGIGISGYMQITDEQKSWLDETYVYLREYDEMYSKLKKVNPSVKLTTVKPSGTLSLLPGITPGVHPGYAQYMIRRIRVDANHVLVHEAKQKGYDIEYAQDFEGNPDLRTKIISFPFSYPEGTVLAKDMTAMDQIAAIKEVQTLWSDNSVSCTVYYRKEEIPEIKAYLRDNFRHNHKTLSFLLHKDHGYAQAPYEEITKEEYDEMVARVEPMDTMPSDAEMLDLDVSAECASGSCPIR